MLAEQTDECGVMGSHGVIALWWKEAAYKVLGGFGEPAEARDELAVFEGSMEDRCRRPSASGICSAVIDVVSITRTWSPGHGTSRAERSVAFWTTDICCWRPTAGTAAGGSWRSRPLTATRRCTDRPDDDACVTRSRYAATFPVRLYGCLGRDALGG